MKDHVVLHFARALRKLVAQRDRPGPVLSAACDDLDRALCVVERPSATVAVVGSTKAGKSTVLNALLGAELLPASNVPATAECVVLVGSARGAMELTIDDACVARGDDWIRAELGRSDSEMRERGARRPRRISLSAPWAALPISVDGLTLQLVDTPGLNEADAAWASELTELRVAEADGVIYVFDYTHLRTTDEATILLWLRALRPELFTPSAGLAIFVLNKLDARSRHEREGREPIALLTELLEDIFGSNRFAVCGLQAERALQSRLILTGHASPSVLADFTRQADAGDDVALVATARRRVAMSGIESLETAIRDLATRAVAIRNQRVRQAIERVLASAAEEFETAVASARELPVEPEGDERVVEGQVAATALAARLREVASEVSAELTRSFDAVLEGRPTAHDSLAKHSKDLGKAFASTCYSAESAQGAAQAVHDRIFEVFRSTAADRHRQLRGQVMAVFASEQLAEGHVALPPPRELSDHRVRADQSHVSPTWVTGTETSGTEAWRRYTRAETRSLMYQVSRDAVRIAWQPLIAELEASTREWVEGVIKAVERRHEEARELGLAQRHEETRLQWWLERDQALVTAGAAWGRLQALREQWTALRTDGAQGGQGGTR